MVGRLTALTLLAVMASGCIVSPLPVPPPVTNVDPEDVVAQFCETCGDPPVVELSGGPGSVANPEGAILWIVSLNYDSPPVTFDVAPDGSFSADALGNPGDELRMQVRVEDRRSPPLDAIIGSSGLQPSVRSYEECFTMAPADELDFGRVSQALTQDIELLNDCEEELSFEPVRLRIPTTSFEVGTGPTTLAVGESTTISVEFAAAELGLAEEILFIEVAAPERDRRPVTLIGEATEDE